MAISSPLHNTELSARKKDICRLKFAIISHVSGAAFAEIRVFLVFGKNTPQSRSGLNNYKLHA
jgi:hypothetical protein